MIAVLLLHESCGGVGVLVLSFCFERIKIFSLPAVVIECDEDFVAGPRFSWEFYCVWYFSRFLHGAATTGKPEEIDVD